MPEEAETMRLQPPGTGELSAFLATADEWLIKTYGRCYCGATLGEHHHADCVKVKRSVTYRVLRDGREIGEWVTDEPAEWDLEMCNFAREPQGSWCVDNIFATGTLKLLPGVTLEEPEDDDPCLCGVVTCRAATLGAHVWMDR